MKTTYSVLDMQVDSLLKGIADDRDARITEIITAAEERAADMIPSAQCLQRHVAPKETGDAGDEQGLAVCHGPQFRGRRLTHL